MPGEVRQHPGPTTNQEACGWNEARCDLHRIVPGGPYTKENKITLCPNCHRVETERARLQDGSGGHGL